MYDNLPEVLDITLQRADRNVITLFKSGDFTDKLIKHVVKSVKGVAGTRVLQKSWTPGDPPVENGIAVSYAKGETKFVITYNRADFFNLDKSKYYFSITAVDPDDTENFDTLWQGEFILNPNVEDEGDGTASSDASEYVDQVYNGVALIVVNGDGTKAAEKKAGFAGITFSTSRSAKGVTYIDASSACFDEKISVVPALYNSAGFADYYSFFWRIVSSTRIAVIAKGELNGPADIAYQAEIKRRRT